MGFAQAAVRLAGARAHRAVTRFRLLEERNMRMLSKLLADGVVLAAATALSAGPALADPRTE